MKKIVICSILLASAGSLFAQVGIGTELPNSSAQLEVVATDKGVLLPNVALTGTDDTVTIVNGNVDSMIIYNTATDGATGVDEVTPGYYYWNEAGTVWLRLNNDGDEAITELVQNTDDTYTYTSEDGTETSFDGMEPWFGTEDAAAATDNTESIYVLSSWVGIGTDAGQTAVSQERLFVDGPIRTTNSYYADYVFQKHFTGSSDIKEDYSLLGLDQVEDFIQDKHHLPGVTGIDDVVKTKNGEYSFDVTELSVQSLEKIEELFLYVIDQEKKIQALQKRMAKLENLK